MATPQATHLCMARFGNSLRTPDARPAEYVADADDELLSGRIVYKNTDGKYVEGFGANTNNMLWIVHQGTDWAHVGGQGTIHASLTDDGIGQLAGGTMGAYPFLPGWVFFTTEYDTDDSYSRGDYVDVAGASDGHVELADSDTAKTVRAQVYSDGLVTKHGSQGLEIEVVRAPDYST